MVIKGMHNDRQRNSAMPAPCSVWDTRCNRARTPRTNGFRFFVIAIVVIGVLALSSPALAQTATQCQENEMLLEIQVSYQPMDMNEYLDIIIQGPRLPNIDANQSNIEIYSYTQNLIDNGTVVTDNEISLCVPDDQCLQVTAKLFSSFPIYYEDFRYQLPSDDIVIVYNGQVWSEKKGPFAYSVYGTMVVAELGPCEVVCESEEVLLEMEAVTGYNPEYDWQVFDDATGQLIKHCTAPFRSSSTCYWESEQYYHERLCLPRGGCYTLLVGEQASDLLEFDAKSLNVYFDGGNIESFEYLRFINVAVNDGSTVCDATYCDSDSSLVELYFFRENFYMEDDRNLTWSLSAVEGSLSPGDLGMGTVTSGDRELQYHKVCIPKVDSCIQLSTSVAQGFAGTDSTSLGRNLPGSILDEGDYQENVTFRFAMDGIIYVDYYFDFGYNDYNVNGTFEFDYSVGNCSYSQICGNNSDFYPAQLEIITQPTWRTSQVPFKLSSRSETGESSITFFFDLYPDQQYIFAYCINELWLMQKNSDPEYCTELASSNPQFLDGNGSYNVSVYGESLTGQQSSTWMYYANDGQVTRFAGQCQAGSSSESARERIVVDYKVATLATLILVGLRL